MLTKNERNIIADLLEEASSEFSNHGCNDFPMENTDENWAILVDMYEKNGDPENIRDRPAPGEPIYFYDWWLMSYFAKKIKGIE